MYEYILFSFRLEFEFNFKFKFKANISLLIFPVSATRSRYYFVSCLTNILSISFDPKNQSVQPQRFGIGFVGLNLNFKIV